MQGLTRSPGRCFIIAIATRVMLLLLTNVTSVIYSGAIIRNVRQRLSDDKRSMEWPLPRNGQIWLAHIPGRYFFIV